LSEGDWGRGKKVLEKSPKFENEIKRRTKEGAYGCGGGSKEGRYDPGA